MGIVQVKSDNVFKRRMRRHQSWYRDCVLGVPYGTGPWPRSSTKFGNMLTKKSADAGCNFLTPGISDLAKSRIAEGTGKVDDFRLLRNMLSSQPMCFNLFGELALDHNLATKLARALWGEHIARITDVRIEWAPEPAAEYLDDRTAFDAFIEYVKVDRKFGFIGIETKLTEPFSKDFNDKGERYSRWMNEDSPWGADALNKVPNKKHNQLLRDHLLAWSLLRSNPKYTEGCLSVVYHPEDPHCGEVVKGYRAFLRDDKTFSAFSLDEIVSAWKPLVKDTAWLSDFELRYLLLEKSEGVLT